MDTMPRPEEPHLLREWVKYQLKLKGITLSSLAKEHGGRRDLTSRVFTQRSPKWEKIVADAMLMMPKELWPERYGEQASCKAKPCKRKSTRKSRGMQ